MKLEEKIRPCIWRALYISNRGVFEDFINAIKKTEHPRKRYYDNCKKCSGYRSECIAYIAK
jgi:hypothetical protein